MEVMRVCDSVVNKWSNIAETLHLIGPKFFLDPLGQKIRSHFFLGHRLLRLGPGVKNSNMSS